MLGVVRPRISAPPPFSRGLCIAHASYLSWKDNGERGGPPRCSPLAHLLGCRSVCHFARSSARLGFGTGFCAGRAHSAQVLSAGGLSLAFVGVGCCCGGAASGAPWSLILPGERTFPSKRLSPGAVVAGSQQGGKGVMEFEKATLLPTCPPPSLTDAGRSRWCCSACPGLGDSQ